MKNIFKFTAIALIALTLTNCKKDKDNDPEPAPMPAPTTPATTGSLNIEFEAMVGDSALEFGTANTTYTNQAGNTFNVSMYKYYISNIKVTKMDNSVWTESNSYHLIDHSNASSTIITLANVPFASYKAIEFMIGVDSARNNSGAQTGALDVSNGMFWSWSSGYIMAKFEGTSPQSAAAANKLTFHIGGFGGANKTMKIVSPSFGTETANVSSSITPTIHLKSDLLEWFKTPTNTDFSTTHTVHMPGAAANTVASNYADMFTVEHIHN